MECSATVYEQPWTNTRELSDYSCGESKSVKSFKYSSSKLALVKSKSNAIHVGEPSRIDTEENEIKDAVDDMIEYMNENSRYNSNIRAMVTRVVHAEKQVSKEYTSNFLVYKSFAYIIITYILNSLADDV